MITVPSGMSLWGYVPYGNAPLKFSIIDLSSSVESPEPQKTPQLQAFSALPLCHQCHALNVARVVLMHTHISGTRIHLAEENIDTIFLA